MGQRTTAGGTVRLEAEATSPAQRPREVSGPRAALDSLGVHRDLRDSRTRTHTHTLHDPARWKVQHTGRHVLNGSRAPRRGLL